MVGPRTSRAFPGPTALWAILACVLWGSAFPAARIALQYVPPLLIAGLRFILAGLLLLPLCGRWSAMGVALRKHWRLVLAVSFLQTMLLYGTFFLGMQLIRGAQGAVIIGSAPLVSAVMAHFLMHNDRMTPARAVAIALGMAGVAILALHAKPWSRAGLVEIGGMALLLVGVVSSALSGIVVAKNRKGISPFVLNSAQMTLGGVILLILGVCVHGPLSAAPPAAWFGALLWLATISATGFSIWFALLKREKVSDLNMWKFVIPLSGVLLSWALAPGESPNWPTAAGMACVVVAVLLNHRYARNGTPAP